MRNLFYAFIAALAIQVLALRVCSAAENGPKSVVENLYRDYAWEAAPGNSRRTVFINETQRNLEKYLTKTLASQVHKDSVCTEKTKEICKLDFSPLWASQDPEGALVLSITSRTEKAVEAQIKYPSGEIMSISFDVVETEFGWRIDDIRTKDWALRRILGH